MPARAADPQAIQGLLHELGNEMTALSYLVESVREDAPLPGDSGLRLELLSGEMSRLLEIIENGMRGLHGAQGPDEATEVDLRSLAGQVAHLGALAHTADVTLLPGPGVRLLASPAVLWRVLADVVDNAARAASPGGQVTVSVGQAGDTVIEVTGTGPGSGSGGGRPGKSSPGLGAAASLLHSRGGTLEIRSPSADGGTVVRITLPSRVDPAYASAGADRGE
ncbi:MAG: HAMP domain-containing histidine kinase [Actinobacteria bacterium]|nr:HAMP domain-containing histidine kinase [Actinomycetota bacterium]